MHTPEYSGETPEQLRALLFEDGEDFVEAAYQALLHRRPDATGGRIYLRELRNGMAKLQILFELANSKESQHIGASLPGLADACARAGIGQPVVDPQLAVPAEVAKVTRGEQLLAIDDYDKLIEMGYWVLLKRAPDDEGIANYLEKLKGDTSKTKFLHHLFTSSECRELGVELPGLREMFAREELLVPDLIVQPATATVPDTVATTANGATDLVALIRLHGPDFVTCAYLTLLDHQAAAGDLQRHAEQLLAGVAKIEILNEIAASAESRRARDFPGLSAALRRFRLSRLPILGTVFKLFATVEGDSPAERRGRAAEQRLAMLESALVEKIGRLEEKISEIAAVQERAAATDNSLGKQIASLEESAVMLRQLVQHAEHMPPAAATECAETSVKPAEALVIALRALEITRDLKRMR